MFMRGRLVAEDLWRAKLSRARRLRDHHPLAQTRGGFGTLFWPMIVTIAGRPGPLDPGRAKVTPRLVAVTGRRPERRDLTPRVRHWAAEHCDYSRLGGGDAFRYLQEATNQLRRRTGLPHSQCGVIVPFADTRTIGRRIWVVEPVRRKMARVYRACRHGHQSLHAWAL